MQRFKPSFVKKESAFVFFCLLILQVFFSTAVHSDEDNILSTLAWGCSVALMSQMYYSCVCSFKYTKYILEYVTASKHGHDKEKSKQQYAMSATSMACDSSFFFEDESSKRYPLSRGALWRILYPLSCGIFLLFVFVPVFDSSCACLLSLGFMIRSMYVEFVRGNRYHRPITRRVLFSVVTLSGVLAFVFIFVLAHSTGAEVTNAKAQDSIDYLQEHNLDIISNLHNSSLSAGSNHVENKDIISEFMTKMKVSNPAVVQYVKWTVDSYTRRMTPVWILSFTAPFFICYLPEQSTSLFVLETTHTSVSFFAAATMCAIAVVMDRQPFILLHKTTASGTAYLILSPILMWGLIFRLFEYQRRRIFAVPACLILVVTFIKHCAQHGALLQQKFFNEIAVVGGIVVSFYSISTFIFVRLENSAILLEKWGSSDEGLVQEGSQLENFTIGDMDDDDEEVDKSKGMNSGNVASSEAIKRVLQEAREDIEMAKGIIQEEQEGDTDEHKFRD